MVLHSLAPYLQVRIMHGQEILISGFTATLYSHFWPDVKHTHTPPLQLTARFGFAAFGGHDDDNDLHHAFMVARPRSAVAAACYDAALAAYARVAGCGVTRPDACSDVSIGNKG